MRFVLIGIFLVFFFPCFAQTRTLDYFIQQASQNSPVVKDYQNQGIGTQLIKHVQSEIGEEIALILLSAPSAMNYYPKVGFHQIDNGFKIDRIR